MVYRESYIEFALTEMDYLNTSLFSPCRCQFHAMDTLHKHNYDLSSAISVLVPLGGPVLCRDEMEEWSASEASLFEEALEKYGKDFNDIRQDFVSMKVVPFPVAVFCHG